MAFTDLIRDKTIVDHSRAQRSVLLGTNAMELDPSEIEEVCKTLYIRALKLLPRDVKEGFAELQRRETDATGSAILATMVENIAVAERTRNLLCQDTGIPIYNVTIGSGVGFD